MKNLPTKQTSGPYIFTGGLYHFKITLLYITCQITKKHYAVRLIYPFWQALFQAQVWYSWVTFNGVRASILKPGASLWTVCLHYRLHHYAFTSHKSEKNPWQTLNFLLAFHLLSNVLCPLPALVLLHSLIVHSLVLLNTFYNIPTLKSVTYMYVYIIRWALHLKEQMWFFSFWDWVTSVLYTLLQILFHFSL